MSKADKMFEMLGLKRIEGVYEDCITYRTEQKEKLIRFVTFDTTYKYVINDGTITKYLHLAIHEKMKELGWI